MAKDLEELLAATFEDWRSASSVSFSDHREMYLVGKYAVILASPRGRVMVCRWISQDPEGTGEYFLIRIELITDWLDVLSIFEFCGWDETDNCLFLSTCPCHLYLGLYEALRVLGLGQEQEAFINYGGLGSGEGSFRDHLYLALSDERWTKKDLRRILVSFGAMVPSGEATKDELATAVLALVTD